MPNRREFDHVLGRIFTDRSFGDRVLRNAQEALKSCGVALTDAEIAQLAKLNHMDVWRVRMSLGVA